MRDNDDLVAYANSFDEPINVELPSPDESSNSLGVQSVVFLNTIWASVMRILYLSWYQ